MTLLSLKKAIKEIHIGGRFVADDAKLEMQQQRAFNKLFSWCEPLNLLIPFDDRDVFKIVDSVWRLKKPLIAKFDSHYIDIDERLDMAFTYIMISLMITGNGAESKMDKAEYEEMAYREALEYAVGIEHVGYDNAKRVYEQESFIEGVEFDCLGRVYLVSSEFVTKVIDCILCGRQCLNSAESKQLEIYKAYIAGTVRAVDKEKLLAVDKAVFHRLMNDEEKILKYDSKDLALCTTLFCEFSKIDQGVVHSDFADVESKRMGFMECDKPMCCKTNNRCEGI